MCDILQEPEEESKEEFSGTISMDNLTTEEAVHLLSKKFSERFTTKDALFMETLDRATIEPPIMLNYNGRQPLHGRRHGGFNNRRFDNNDGGRRYDHREGGGRRYDNGGDRRFDGNRRNEYDGGRRFERNDRR